MKKLLALLLAAVMALSVVACGSTNNEESGEAVAIKDALEVLTTVWGTYEETELFPVAGGDAENVSWEGPAKFNVAATEELEATYGVTADLAANVDDAATMMHAMMMNNFALGAYHLTDAAKMDEFTNTLKTNLLEKQWLCGQPEKVIVITLGEYVIAGYGLADLIDTFEAKLTAAYPAATVVCEENIA